MSENVYGELPLTPSTALSDDAHQALLGMGPWHRFLAVMLGLASATSCCMGGVIGAGLGATGDRVDGVMMVGLAAAYALLAALYVGPTVFLWRSASAIARLRATGAAEHATAALQAQRSFWRLVGFMVATVVILYVTLIGGIVLLAALADLAG